MNTGPNSAEPHLEQIWLYPIKSLDGVAVERVRVLDIGALQHDRRWAIRDHAGKFVNAKRSPALHTMRAKFTFADGAVRGAFASSTAGEGEFDLATEQRPLEAFLSRHFGFPVVVVEDVEVGFPDDFESPGPTIISAATLDKVAGWFGLTREEARRRYRANLELAGAPAFWEDRLYTADESPLPFRLGAVKWMGTNPCQRCVVPTRDSQTGELTPSYAARFMAERQAALPTWAPAVRFNHFNRLAVNTRLAAPGVAGELAVGDVLLLP